MNGTKQDLTTHCSPIVLQEYLDDELPQDEVTVVDRHLFMCTECKAELTRQISLFADIDTVLENSFPLPVDFADIVVANAARQFHPFYFGIREMMVVILVAAVLSIFAILTFFGAAELLPITARYVAIWNTF